MLPQLNTQCSEFASAASSVQTQKDVQKQRVGRTNEEESLSQHSS